MKMIKKLTPAEEWSLLAAPVIRWLEVGASVEQNTRDEDDRFGLLLFLNRLMSEPNMGDENQHGGWYQKAARVLEDMTWDEAFARGWHNALDAHDVRGEG